MKNSDKKTEMQPEEAKPVEEIKSQPTAKPEKTTKPAAKPAKATPAASAKSKTAAKPKETTKKATKPAAPVEEVKAETTEQPVEEVKPAEEPKAEQPVPEQQPVEEVKAEAAATAPEKPAEDKSDKKSFFSSKRNIAIVACAGAAVFALSLGLGLGLGLKKNGDEDEEEPVKTAFSVPAGVTVTESTLSWTAVDNATNGYTIKFAESEKEKSVTSVSYNLLGDTTYLVEGTNTLSVKVNATDTYNASAYSATVTYTYVLPAVEEKFDAPVGLKVEEKVLKWTAVAGATSYTVKINDDETTTVNTNSLDLTTVTTKLNEGENVISVKVNAVGDKKASDYSATVKYTYVDEDKTAATAFASLIDALDITATDAEAKLTAAKAAYAELSARAKELAAASYAKLKDVDGKYFVSLVEKIGTVTEDSGDSIAAAVTYYATVIDTTAENVVTAKATLDEKNSQYQHFYESYVAAFGELVNAIVIENNSRGEVIDTALEAIGTAEEYYNAQTAKVKAALAELKVTLDSKKTAYAAAVKAEMDGYTALVDEALDLVEAASDLTALTAKKAEITAYELSDVNKTAVEADDELTANIASIDTAIESWNTAISDAVAALTVTVSGDDEADIVSATEALAGFENYAAYIKVNASVIAAKTATEEVLATAKHNIETTVNDIKRAAEAAIENTEPNEINYAALKAQKDALEEVDGAYATQYLETLKIGDDGVKEAVEKAMETMLATAVDTAGGEAYSLTGTTLKITLFRTFYNFRNEKIAATDSANAPKLTVDGNTVTVEQDFTKNELNEYVAIINIENLGVIGDDATYTVTVGSDENAFALKFGETIGENPYFTDTDEEVDGTPTGFKKAIDGDNFVMNFQGGCTAEKYYLEVYNAEAITIDGEFVKFSEMPLGRIDVTGKQTMPIEDFNRLIANSLSDIFIDKTVTVRFMIYGTTVTDEVPAFTAMNASVISEAIEFNLVEADKYYRLPTSSIDAGISTGEEGTLTLVVTAEIGNLLEKLNPMLEEAGVNVTLTTENYKNYLQMKVEIYDANDDNKAVLRTVYTELVQGGLSVADIVSEWQKDYFKEHGNVEEPEYKIGIRLSYCAKTGTEITKYFPRAEAVDVIINRGDPIGIVTYENDIVLSKETLILPNTAFKSTGSAFEFLRDEKGVDGYVGNGKIFEQGDALYLEIKFYLADGENETNVNYAYLFNDNGNAVIYKNKEDFGKEDTDTVKIAKLGVGIITNSYIFFNDELKNFFKDNYVANGYPMRWDDGWTFVARYVLNPESQNYLFDSDWSTPIHIEEKSLQFTSAAQVAYNIGTGSFEFFLGFNVEGNDFVRGGIFTNEYKTVDKVELHFYQGDTESTEYCIDLTYDEDTGNIVLSYKKDGVITKITSAMSGQTMDNGWCYATEFNAIISEYLTGIESGDNFTGEWKIYTVTHLREGSKVFSGGDENGNVKSDEYSYTAE